MCRQHLLDGQEHDEVIDMVAALEAKATGVGPVGVASTTPSPSRQPSRQPSDAGGAAATLPYSVEGPSDGGMPVMLLPKKIASATVTYE